MGAFVPKQDIDGMYLDSFLSVRDQELLFARLCDSGTYSGFVAPSEPLGTGERIRLQPQTWCDSDHRVMWFRMSSESFEEGLPCFRDVRRSHCCFHV